MTRANRRGIGLVIIIAVITAGAIWNARRTERIGDVINPVYWIKRLRGKDLYDMRQHVLYHGNRSLKEIALTIDDGPHAQTGAALLDIFKEHGVRATFFVVGRRMKENPDLVRRMIAEGHEVANHTQDHIRLDTLHPDQMRREIEYCDTNFRRITGRRFSLMRPPGMRFNDAVLGVTARLGYVVVSWSCAAKDFLEVSPEFVRERIVDRTENGSIILLHDDRPATVEAMPRIIEELKGQGYQFVTVSEMLAHLPEPVHVRTTANRPAGVNGRRADIGARVARSVESVGTHGPSASVTVDR